MAQKFRIEETLYQSNTTQIFKAYDIERDRSVILKTLNERFPSIHRLSRIHFEHQFLKDLNIDGVISVFEITSLDTRPVLVEEDFGGIPLSSYFKRNLTLNEKLKIFIEITEILGQIHNRNIIHKDITPSNILINPVTSAIRFIDFEFATRLKKEIFHRTNENFIEGTFAFMAPEQTGRMNRPVDFRSDYYSMGATFYRLLTGKNLFPEARDPMEQVYNQIAANPQAPDEVDPLIPPGLSDMILKLLEKNAEDRYQSIEGILFDLRSCLDKHSQGNDSESFPLASRDYFEELQIPQKLYGRDGEMDQLIESFDRVVKGSFETLLIYGYSGIGKSSLINELSSEKSGIRSFFVTGKYDQYRKNSPYSAIIEAFSQLINDIISRGGSEIEFWKNQILSVSGRNGAVLTEVLPELELIIGPQPPVQSLPPQEAKNRFNSLFFNFIKIFASKDHPLILCLDDLQWVDRASLQFLRQICSAESRFIFLICAFRDNEVGKSHHFQRFIQELEGENTPLGKMHLKPLKIDDVNHLMSDCLLCDQSETTELSNLIIEKTDGNPFFINQFLRHLYSEELLDFDKKERKWTWNMESILKEEITDNVIHMMIGKIKRLDTQTQNLMKLASFLGNTFTIRTLSLIYGKAESGTYDDLWTAMLEGLILPLDYTYKYSGRYNSTDSSFKFLHDKVQQASYELSDSQEREKLHLSIGRILVDHFSEEELEENLFLITDHMNKGASLLEEREEKILLAQLDLKTGIKAMKSSAYKAASQLFDAGISIIEGDIFKDLYDLRFNLMLESTEALYLCRDYEKSEERFSKCLALADNNEDRSRIYRIMMLNYISVNKFNDCIELGIQALKNWSITLPDQGNQTEILKAYEIEKEEYTRLMKGRQISALYDLPSLSDKRLEICMDLLASMVDAAYLGNPHINPLLILLQVNISISAGNSELSPAGYVWWGVILIVDGLYEEAYEFGNMALKLSKIYDNDFISCRTHHMFGGFLQLWKEPVDASIVNLKKAFLLGSDSGDINFSNYAATIYNRYAFYKGESLAEVAAEAEECLHYMEKTSHSGMKELHTAIYYANLSLQGKTSNRYLLHKDNETEVMYLSQWTEKNMILQICLFSILKLYLHYLYGDFQKALDFGARAEETIMGIFPQFDITQIPLYSGLCCLKMMDDKPEERDELLNRATSYEKQLYAWSLQTPENCRNKYLLLKAEISRVEERYLEAMEDFEESALLAKESGFLQEEALAMELYGSLWHSLNKRKIAALYISEAIYGYEKWGAHVKSDALRHAYREILTDYSFNSKEEKRESNSISSGTTTDSLDMLSIIKSFQVISKEVKYENLIRTLMELVLENAGAQKGFYISNDEDSLKIIAMSRMDKEVTTEILSIPISESGSGEELLIPYSLIFYVYRTKKDLVLSNASSEGKFVDDEYIRKSQSKSIICMPIMIQGRIAGIIYLENNLMTNVFSPKMTEVLKLIASQTAISLVNIQFVETLESKVHERTRQLEELTEELKLMSIVDQLTGLFNRRKLDEVIEYEFSKLNRHERQFSLIILDIDKFKSINDSFGHQSGDQVLIKLGEILRENIRQTDTVGRWGGEEFLIICPDTKKEDALGLAEKLRVNIEKTDFSITRQVTSSFGVSSSDESESLEELMRKADEVLYRAKRSGRNKVFG